MAQDTPNPDLLKAAYAEICQAHNQIADFRAKLLALLPIASSGGILVLLGQAEPTNGLTGTAIGVLAALLTFGIYLYELRGIGRCNELNKSGSELEKHVLGPLHSHGAFSCKRERVSYASNTNAALIIYPTMISGWVLVALDSWKEVLGTFVLLAICVVSWSVLFRYGKRVDKAQDDMLGARHPDRAATASARANEKGAPKDALSK